MKIGILIALRNEEKVLPRLLDSIDKLEKDGFETELIFANDGSTDGTSKMLEDYCDQYSWATVLNVPERTQEDTLMGKMRALAYIESLSKAPILLFTDADISLPPTWIREMVQGFEDSRVGIVVGITEVAAVNPWAILQSIEWLVALFVMHVSSLFGLKSTGMGNNMAIRKSALDSIGGFSNQAFSIVEDYAIYNALIKAGFGFKHIFKKEVLAITLPPERYFEQRRRWLKGAFESGSSLVFLSMMQSVFLPLGILFLFFIPIIGLGMISFHYLLLTFFIGSISFKLHKYHLLLYIIPFGLYISFGSLIQMADYYFGKKVIWKGRTYG